VDPATITALCAGIVTIITALTTLLITIGVGRKVDVVKDQTNGHLTVLTARNEQLTATLTDAAVPVPPPPPVVVTEPPAA
jgi:hypothetical protein